MLTPVQSGRSIAVTNVMQSIVDGIEQRRQEEAEKQDGRKDDALQKAMVRSDQTHQRSNARINEHFFGSDANKQETIATLVSRFAAALGLSQQSDESARAFAQRLADMVALAGTSANRDYPGGPAKISLASVGTTLEAVKTAMSGGKTDDAAANMVARLAAANGITQGEAETDADFETRLNSALSALRGTVPKSVEALEQQTGLKDLGISASELIAAIRNPYGTEAQKIKAALSDKAREEKALTPEMRKVLDRLEDVANPKTKEELRLESIRRDPTKVEDAETRQEREHDIRALEARGKLEDVQALQEAIGKANDAADGTGAAQDTGGLPQDAVAQALSTIQLLAAGLEALDAADQAEETDIALAEKAGNDNTAPAGGATEEQKAMPALPDNAKDDPQTRAKDIFVLRVDENGVYDLITRQLAGI